MNLEEKRERYRELAHAMQSGVAMMMNYNGTECQPKHLRVGVNAAMSDHGALVKLLIDKGVFTEDEYYDYLIEFMERERDSYVALIREAMGAGPDQEITLG